MLFIPGLEAGDLSDKAAVDAALAGAIYWPAGTTTLCGIEVPGLLFALSTSTALNPYPLALFGEGQSGGLWQCTLPASLRAATDGTGDAALGGTIARINDSSGNALHLTQASTSLRPIRGRRPKTGARNRLKRTEELGPPGWTTIRCTVAANAGVAPDGTSTADKTVQVSGQTDIGLITQSASYPASTAVVLSIFARAAEKSLLAMGTDAMSVPYGVNSYAYFNLTTGEVGTVAAGLSASIQDVGGGWYRCSISATSRASDGNVSLITGGADTNGSLVVTDTGGIYLWGAQSEQGVVPSPYQAVGATSYDITETGVDPVSFAAFDLVDDALTTGAIAGGLTGQAFVAGDGGCYVSDLSIAPGGTFTIGYTAYNSYSWTGAAPGLLRAVTDNTGRVLDAMIRAGAYTEDEIIRLERYYRALGGKGLLVPTGPNLVPGGDFGSAAGWTLGAGWSISGGTATFATTGVGSNLTCTIATTAGAWYLMEADLLTVSGYSPTLVSYAVLPDAVSPLLGTDPGHRAWAWRALASTTVVGLRGAPITDIASFDNLSVRRLIPREDL